MAAPRGSFREVTTLADLPGGALVTRGLSDTRQGRTSAESLLVAIAAPRLVSLGLHPYGPAGRVADPELALYALLGEGKSDPYSSYNALLRELTSFVRALEHRVARERRLASETPP
jgi:hypothetical protein